MNRARIYLMILMMFFSLSSYSQDFGNDQSEINTLQEADLIFTDSDNGEAIAECMSIENSEKPDDPAVLDQSGSLIRRQSLVKDSTGIRYVKKYNLNNFPFFNFRINKNKVYHKLSEFESEQAMELFVLAKNDQFNSDSLSREVNILYSKQGVYSVVDRDLFVRRVTDLEQRAAELKKNAKQKAKHALALEQGSAQSSNLILAATHEEATPEYKGSSKSLAVENSIPKKKTEETIKNDAIASSKAVSVSESVVNQQTSDQSDGGYLDYEYEYCYQVAVFDKRPNNEFYKGMGFIKEEIVDGGKSFRYLTGSYRTYAKANSYRSQIKSVFPAAFIVVYKNGIRTSLKEAKDITDPVTSKSGAGVTPNYASDLSGEITYRIQIGVFAGEIPEELNTIMERYQAFGSFYEKRPDGMTVCTIGRFKSISEVGALKRKLQDSGYSDAFTVAYSGKKRVSLQASIKKTEKAKAPVVAEQPVIKENKPQLDEGDLTGDINFRVQVGVFANEVPEDIRRLMDKYKAFGVFYEKRASGKTVCTIGQFDSISDAGALKKKLHESGYSDAFTVAYSGNQRISIQDAIRLVK